MEIKDAEAIKAAKLLKQYCREMACKSCIFYLPDDCNCILSGIDDYGYEYDRAPLDWRIDLIKGE